MKRLIVTCDGTWKDDEDPGRHSNVAKIHRLIAREDAAGTRQVKTYLPGVGTGSRIEKILAGITGAGVTSNVLTGYNYLAQNYEPGDQIYVFGFSRGAYTARAIAGLIGDHGLLRQRSGFMQRLAGLVSLWQTFKHHHRRHARDERARAETVEDARDDVSVECIGVWDTVGALGVPLRIDDLDDVREDIFQFHNTRLGPHVRNAYHAVAIDEKRMHFDVALWTGDQPAGTRNVEQTWFSGVHSDVGGGYEDAGLSDLTLSWMIDRVQRASGLAFNDRAVARLVGRHDGLLHESRQGPHYVIDRASPSHREIGKSNHDEPPLNEHIHRSAVQRFDTVAPEEDEEGSVRNAGYRPSTLAAALNRLPVAE